LKAFIFSSLIKFLLVFILIASSFYSQNKILNVVRCVVTSLTTTRFLPCLLIRCVLLGRFFEFNHKIMINIQESPPSIMVIRIL